MIEPYWLIICMPQNKDIMKHLCQLDLVIWIFRWMDFWILFIWFKIDNLETFIVVIIFFLSQPEPRVSPKIKNTSSTVVLPSLVHTELLSVLAERHYGGTQPSKRRPRSHGRTGERNVRGFSFKKFDLIMHGDSLKMQAQCRKESQPVSAKYAIILFA